MELLDVVTARVAREVSTGISRLRLLALAIIVLLLLRLAFAATTPLAFDEAYYWLWSKHLAAGYFDHPPLIAYCIRIGTVLFGDTSLGVRAAVVALSAAASWAVWRVAAMVLGSEIAGGFAALLFNLMPMVGVESLVATPDAPEVAASAFLLWALVKVDETGKGRWWLAVGAAAGFALLAKYTAFFLGAGILVWLAAAPRQRHWFLSPWPYLGAAVALIMFAPVLWWNATHGWASFSRQFGRAGEGGLTLRFLGEFLGTQLALATPFIAILGTAGFFRILRRRAWDGALAMVAALLVPAVLFFLLQSLHGRVQGNWPSFLYPQFAILAVAAAQGANGRVLHWSRRLAAPVATAMMLVLYAQVLWGVIPLTRDPVARLLAYGIEPVTHGIEDLRMQTGARAILTTNYGHTGWFAFYLPSRTPVVQINERYRWTAEPPPDPALFDGPLLYVTDTRRDESDLLRARFAEVEPLQHLPRMAHGTVFDDFVVYRVSRPRGSVLGD